MPEKNPTVARLKRLIAELENFGYDDVAEEIKEDLTWWEKVGGGPAGEISAEELQELAEAASRVSWDAEGVEALRHLGEDDSERGEECQT